MQSEVDSIHIAVETLSRLSFSLDVFCSSMQRIKLMRTIENLIWDELFTGLDDYSFHSRFNQRHGMKQGTRFTKETQACKLNIRLLRLKAGHTVREGAKKLKISLKQMEDVETTRNYGCYLNLDLLVQVAKIYEVSLDSLIRGPK